MKEIKISHPLAFSYQAFQLPIPIQYFIEEVKRMLFEKQIVPSTNTKLEKLHEVVSQKDQKWDDLLFNQVSKQFYLLSEKFINHYESLISEIAQKEFEFDFLFQKQPIIRFHFPKSFPKSKIAKSGWAHYLHSDLFGGHPPEMIQFWIPLTECNRHNTLEISEKKVGQKVLKELYAEKSYRLNTNLLHRFAQKIDEETHFQKWIRSSCQPTLLNLGEMLVFDPHCIHGAIEHKDQLTRVSMDFRIIPLPKGKENPPSEWIEKYPRFTRGEIMHAKSASELGHRNQPPV